MNRNHSAVFVLAVLAVAMLFLPLPGSGGGSTTYPWPTNWSLGGLASWSQPLIASGTSLPATSTADTGDLYVLVDGATATLYRLTAGAWTTMSAGTSGSTGTDGVSTDTVVAYIATETADRTAAVATVAGDLTNHAADSTDPHTATMTVSSSVKVGSGTEDTYIERSGTGTVTIGSYTCLIPEAATPTGDIATGTHWYDSNTNKERVYDGSAWNDLW